MESLLKRKKYNSGNRPSEHNISKESFLKNNTGSIMHNVIELEQMDPKREVRLPENIFSIANTSSNDYFSRTCRERGIELHPARMPMEMASFFIEFLTEPGDLVLDPFAGSNTTGYCAQKLSRKWISIEAKMAYGMQSIIRFEDPTLNINLKAKEGILGGCEESS
jgi:site-specific DNA-methyltransferase (cytosine-N4-specific)